MPHGSRHVASPAAERTKPLRGCEGRAGHDSGLDVKGRIDPAPFRSSVIHDGAISEAACCRPYPGLPPLRDYVRRPQGEESGPPPLWPRLATGEGWGGGASLRIAREQVVRIRCVLAWRDLSGGSATQLPGRALALRFLPR